MSGIQTVAVVSLGYIGLPTATMLASEGFQVIDVDVNARIVEAVGCGDGPFVEPEFAAYVADAVKEGRLKVGTEMPQADAHIVAVPAHLAGSPEPDLSCIRAAAEAIAPRFVVLESTSPPHATRQMAEWVLALRHGLSLDRSDGRPTAHLAHCPERVLPERVMVEFVTNDRTGGGLTVEAATRATALCKTSCQREIPMTDAVTAEMVKLTENSFRDANIAFTKELSLICGDLGIDVWEFIPLANYHARVCILAPGPGVGEHCAAVDPWFIVDADPENALFIRTAREVNDDKSKRVAAQLVDGVKHLDAPRIAVLGIAFKTAIDDSAHRCRRRCRRASPRRSHCLQDRRPCRARPGRQGRHRYARGLA